MGAIRGRTRYPGLIDSRALPLYAPSEIADLLWWVAAYQLTGLSDGDAISSWTDLSGNGRHATQGTAGRQPTYKVNIINGKSVARFDGGDDVVMTGLNAGSTLSWGFVYQPSATVHSGLFDSAPSQQNVLRNPGSGFAGTIEWWNAAPIFALNLANTNPVYVLLVFDLAPSRRIRYYRNGTLISTNTNASITAAAWLNPRLGSVNSTPVFAGDIAESFLYTRPLTAGERNQLDVYVNALYGLW